MGTQKNHLNKMILSSTQNGVKIDGLEKKYQNLKLKFLLLIITVLLFGKKENVLFRGKIFKRN